MAADKLEAARAANKAKAGKAYNKHGLREMREEGNGLRGDDVDAQVEAAFQGMNLNCMDEQLTLDANGYLMSGNGRGYGF